MEVWETTRRNAIAAAAPSRNKWIESASRLEYFEFAR
jgi:hypothetical protein